MYVSVNYFCHIFLTQFGAHLSVLSRSPGTPVCPVQVSWHTCLSCPSLLAHLSALSKSPGTPVCPVQVSGHTCLSMSRSPRWPLATPDDCLVRKQADGYSGQLLSFCPRHGVSLSSVHVMQFPCPLSVLCPRHAVSLSSVHVVEFPCPLSVLCPRRGVSLSFVLCPRHGVSLSSAYLHSTLGILIALSVNIFVMFIFLRVYRPLKCSRVFVVVVVVVVLER